MSKEELLDSIFICDCGSVDHQIVIRKLPNEDEIFVYVHLIQENNFFKRFWLALKYILGYKSIYGHFSEFVLGDDTKKRMIDFLNNN
jgi:hypothetical protein